MLHIKNVKPLFTNIITTGDRFEKDDTNGGVLIQTVAGSIKPWQTVLAVGSSVRDIKVGDKVMINIDNYLIRKYDPNSVRNDMDANPKERYQFNWVYMEDEHGEQQNCLLLNDRDIMYVFEGEEEEEPAKTIIMPQEKKIILN